jgi:multiple sugar transport system permease protein
MSIRSEAFVGVAGRSHRPFVLSEWVDRGTVFSWLMMAPPVLFIVAFVGYPFFYGIYLSLQDRPVAQPGSFVGLANFIKEAHDPVFWQVVSNTFIYTGVATVLKMVGGLGLALAMNQDFRLKNIIRALLLLPFIVPTVLSTVAFMWMLDPAFSVVNRVLFTLGIPKPGPSWLGSPILAMFSIIMINTWRGLPFYGITLLAGLQTVPTELYEAATIDGASGWQRFRYVTLPILQPIILIVTLFSVIFTFADFQLVYVLTHGGPRNATALFATYAFDIGMSGGQLGQGAAVALAMLPALALLIVAITLYLRKKS